MNTAWLFALFSFVNPALYNLDMTVNAAIWRVLASGRSGNTRNCILWGIISTARMKAV